jgi:hypothetical protein
VRARRFVVVSVVVWVLISTLGVAFFAGCSSTGNAAVTTPAPDAASGPQPIGAPCDPSIAVPCLGAGDPCLTVACDPLTLVCTQHGGDASAVCNGGAQSCAKNADCDLGLVCAFPLAAGCAGGVTGICLNPPLPCQADAAACATGGTACSCDGATVPIVVPGFATAPTVSAGPCGPIGPTDAGDAGGEEGGEAGEGEE